MPKPMTASVTAAIAAAVAISTPLIMQEEGHVSKAVHDVGGVLSVCYGHDGKDIVVNHVYSDSQCKAILTKDITTTANGILAKSPQLINHPYQLASAISFSYNIGVGAYNRSSVAVDFNAGRYKVGCADMLRYTYVKGKYVQGLANRREREYTVCMRDQ